MFSAIYRNSTEKTGKYVKELSLSFPKLTENRIEKLLLVRFLLLSFMLAILHYLGLYSKL